MNIHTVYSCSFCSKEFYDKDECSEHEDKCEEKIINKFKKKVKFTAGNPKVCLNCEYCDDSWSGAYMCIKNEVNGDIFSFEVNPTDTCKCFETKA